MGAKINPRVVPLEASVEDGVLRMHFMDRIIKEVELPIPKVIKIEKHCIYFDTVMENVLVFLRGENYSLIIRSCGNLDLMTRDFVIIHRAKVDVSSLIDRELKIRMCGSMFVKGKQMPAYVAITGMKDVVFIFNSKLAMTLNLDIHNPLNKQIVEWAQERDDVGTMHIKDNTTDGMKLWVNFGTNKYLPMSDFELVSSSGVLGGIVL